MWNLLRWFLFRDYSSRWWSVAPEERVVNRTMMITDEMTDDVVHVLYYSKYDVSRRQGCGACRKENQQSTVTSRLECTRAQAQQIVLKVLIFQHMVLEYYDLVQICKSQHLALAKNFSHIKDKIEEEIPIEIWHVVTLIDYQESHRGRCTLLGQD